MPSELQEGALYPEKILVGHPYNPSYILPLIEIVAGKQTSQETVDAAKAMYDSWGKISVICLKEVYGYIAQHVNWGVRDIALKVVQDGNNFDKRKNIGRIIRVSYQNFLRI